MAQKPVDKLPEYRGLPNSMEQDDQNPAIVAQPVTLYRKETAEDATITFHEVTQADPLPVADTTATAQLTAILAALGGALNVGSPTVEQGTSPWVTSDQTAQTTLAAILAALGGTLGVADATARDTLAGILAQLTAGLGVTSLPAVTQGAAGASPWLVADANTLAKLDALLTALQAVEGTPGQAVPSRLAMLGASDGTNARELKVDGQRNLLVGLRSSGGLEPTISNSFYQLDSLGSAVSLSTAGYGFGYVGNNQWDRIRVPNVFKLVAVDIASGATADIWIPATNKKPRLMGYRLWFDTGSNCTLQDSGTIIDYLNANANEKLRLTLPQGRIAGAVNNRLQIQNPGTGTVKVRGMVWGTEE